MKPKVHARKQYLVNRELQLSYTRLLIICVAIVILIFGLSLWYQSKIYLSALQEAIGEEALPHSYVVSTQNRFLIGSFVAMAIISCLLFILGIYSSHRIAGPMYRITKNMKLVGMENDVDTIQIRKKDQLKEMADAFNHMVHTIKDRMYQDMKMIDQVKMRVSQLHESLKGESLDIKKLSNQVKEIEKLATELKDRKQV